MIAAAGGALAGLALLGVAPGVAAAMALGALLLLTGALHEDGLADAADGLGGGRTAERALEIMADSRIGAFGAAALTVSLLTRWSALSALAVVDPVAAGAALAVAGAVSRSVMAVGLAAWPSARQGGLSDAQGRAPEWAAATALAIGAMASVGLGLFAVGLVAGAAWIAAVAAGALTLLYAARRLGGQTGDVLGAAQQLAEIAFLAGLTAAAR